MLATIFSLHRNATKADIIYSIHLALLTLAVTPLTHQHHHLGITSLITRVLYSCFSYLCNVKNEDLLKDKKGNHGRSSHETQTHSIVMGFGVMTQV